MIPAMRNRIPGNRKPTINIISNPAELVLTPITPIISNIIPIIRKVIPRVFLFVAIKITLFIKLVVT
jgi:hypothetical protein